MVGREAGGGVGVGGVATSTRNCGYKSCPYNSICSCASAMLHSTCTWSFANVMHGHVRTSTAAQREAAHHRAGLAVNVTGIITFRGSGHS